MSIIMLANNDHVDIVGTAAPAPDPAPGTTEPLHVVTLLLSSVTAPLKPITRPLLLVPVVSVTLLDAKILPAKLEPVPSVAELPICQKTLQVWPELIMRTCDAEAVVNALPT